jgi:hypothetical protein
VDQPAQRKWWDFDPQDAVALLLAKREEKFPLEYPIALYMLFLWALWPTDIGGVADSVIQTKIADDSRRNLRNSARCIGAIVAFTKMKHGSRYPYPTDRRIRKLIPLAVQLVSGWHTKFYQGFFDPAGGLSAQFVASKNARSRHKAINEAWTNTLLVRDVVAYLSCMIGLKSQYATRTYILAAIQESIFDKEYRQRRHKKAISDTMISTTWESGPRTAILLYAFQQMWSEITELDISDRAFLVRLCELATDHKRIGDVLMYYEAITSRLSPTMQAMPTLKRWRVLNVPIDVSADLNDEVQQREVFAPEVLHNIESRLKIKLRVSQ